jgi:hypothetical protein
MQNSVGLSFPVPAIDNCNLQLPVSRRFHFFVVVPIFFDDKQNPIPFVEGTKTKS